jgi:transcriptional regulator with GAF, ATPase, and Fis domain
VFLDESGDLPLEVQVKLLASAARKRGSRGSGRHTHAKFDVPFEIAEATNCDLEKGCTSEGRFRSDLFYYRAERVSPIRVPSRLSVAAVKDIPRLVWFFHSPAPSARLGRGRYHRSRPQRRCQ